MSDGQDRSVKSIKKRPDTPRLSLEDVMAAGLPAVYEEHGEHLVYRDGCIFEAPAAGTAEEPILTLDRATAMIGLEFGWRHVAGCACRLCRRDRPRLAQTAPVWQANEASA
jgi:hypothetical protein